MSAKIIFTKENLDGYLNKLAKEFRKINGTKIKAEIILVGGASVLANYNFRDLTYDLDAVIRASSAMKDAINKVGDEHGLPNGWLNSDFKNTSSYSPKIIEYSKFYKQFGYVLDVRTVPREYLVAMKLKSARSYKNDISDALGIISEEYKNGTPLTLEQIKTATTNLYGSWDVISDTAKEIVISALSSNDVEALYKKHRQLELDNKDMLVDFEQEYPGVTTTDNVNDIIEALNKQKAILPNEIAGDGFTQT